MDGNNYNVVNGEKRFVAGGIGADYFLVYAKTNLDAPPHKSLSAFLIDREMGVEVDEHYNLLGCRGMGAARIVLKNVEVPKENLMEEAEKLAGAIASVGPAAVRLAMEAVYGGYGQTLDDGLDREADLFGLTYATEDAAEGLAAFLEKRKAEFKGK